MRVDTSNPFRGVVRGDNLKVYKVFGS
jgi:hypothetical protein